MDPLCTNVGRKRKSEGVDLYDAHRECKYAKQEAQKAATHTYFCHLWQQWLSQDLVKQNASKFQQSGIPSSIMFADREQWKAYPKEVTTALMVCFSAGRSSAKFSVHGKVYLVDFVHMLQLNVQTGSVRSIAWMDQSGELFAPLKRVECHVEDFFSARLHVSDGASVSNASSSISHACSSIHDFAQLGNKLTKLAEDDQEFIDVKEKFLSGLLALSKHACVTGVHKNCYSGTLGHVKLQTFKAQEQATGETRGDANVHNAWHGTSKKGISGIIQHGFGQPGIPKHGVVYGVGVYLAPEDCSRISALYSDVDENGEQHMLSCKVIMGRTEQVYPGSDQFHPSNEEYDTGVDDVENPKRYIIWSTHMGTHILPQYVVSFKLEPSLRAVIQAWQRRAFCLRKCVPVWRQPGESKETCSLRKVEAACIPPTDVSRQCESVDSTVKPPKSPWISFSELLFMVEPKLDSNALSTLQEFYHEFQVGKLSRVWLVKMIRCVVGDVILRECIDSKASKAMLSCGTQALCMDKDSKSSLVSQRYT